MGKPTLIVEIGWGADATNTTPTWSDESAHVREIAIARGRRQSLGEVEAGTCTLLLNNTSRRFDPTGVALGANVRPTTPVRVRATWNSVIYPLFYGLIESIDPGWQTGNVAIARIDCVDGLKHLAALQSTSATTLPNLQQVATRIEALLDLSNWPAGEAWRLFPAGTQITQGPWPVEVGDDLLSLIRKTNEVEGGLFFIDGAGRFVLQRRFHRLDYSAPTLFGSGGLPLYRYGLTYSDRTIVNRCGIQPAGGGVSLAESPTEIRDRYGVYARGTSGTMHFIDPDDDAGVLASWIVNQYQFPLVTIQPIEVIGEMNDGLWPHILGREISDRLRVRVTPPNAGDAGEVDHRGWIDHIQHMITPARWHTTWELQPEATGGWLLGVSGRTELGSTTVLPI
jgi:hypothetical protein